MDYRREPFEDEPDWHGLKAKRKRGLITQRTLFVPFLFGFGVAAAMAVCAVVIMPVFTHKTDTAPVYIRTPLAAVPAVSPTWTIAPLPTPIPVTRAVPTPTALILPLTDHIFRYDNTISAQYIDTLDVQSEPGYQFRGLRFGPDGLLYAAHSYNGGLKCGHADAYWIIQPTASGELSAKYGTLYDPSMIAPKRIAFDSDGNRYVIGSQPVQNCSQFTQAVFKFSPIGQLLSTFSLESLTGEDIAVVSGNRIFVSISGFAGGDVPQAHLLELSSDDSGQLIQVGAYLKDKFDVAYVAVLPAPYADRLDFAATRHGRTVKDCGFYHMPLPTVENPSPSAFLYATVPWDCSTDLAWNVTRLDGLNLVPKPYAAVGRYEMQPSLADATAFLDNDNMVTGYQIDAVDPHGFTISPAGTQWYIASAARTTRTP